MPNSKYKKDSNGRRSPSSITQVLSKVEKDASTGKYYFTYLDDNGDPKREEFTGRRKANLHRARKAKELRQKADAKDIKDLSLVPKPKAKKKSSQKSNKQAKAKKGNKASGKSKRNLPGVPKKEELDFSIREHFEELLELYLAGKGEYYLVNYLHETYGVSLGNAQMRIVPRFKKMFANETYEQAEEIVMNHAFRYEVLYSWFKENGLYRSAAGVMKSKEKLLGLNADLQEVNKEFNKKSQLGIKLQKKDIRKKKRLNALLNKVRKVKNERDSADR